jgi:hypothetical protein
MTDGRSPRIHLPLTLWTLLLIGLVLVEIRHLPPGVTALLLPYLALMARHWVGRLRQRDPSRPVMPRDDAGSPADDGPDEHADPAGPDDRSDCDVPAQPTSPGTAEEPAPSPSRRVRSRRRPKAPEAEPLAAAWVQVRPGRFVRVEEMAPEPPADESGCESRPDDPHGAMPSDGPGAPLEAGSIPPDADADVSESEVDVSKLESDVSEPDSEIEVEVEGNHAGRDTTEATAPSAR